MTISVVVSRYNEDLEFLKQPRFFGMNIFVYNKGINDDFYQTGTITQLPNIGMCDHTYLYHIIQKYHELDDIVVFLPGSCDSGGCGSGNRKELMQEIMDLVRLHNKAVFPNHQSGDNLQYILYDFVLKMYKCQTPENSALNPEKNLALASSRPFGKWYKTFFPDINLTAVQYGGVFSVSKIDILQRPLLFYEKLLAEFKADSNPEVAHYMERSYAAIFHPMSNTVLLRKIRHEQRIKKKKKLLVDRSPNFNPLLMK
jgi:hypothetical protein